MEGEWSFLTEFVWNESSEPLTWTQAIAFGEALGRLEAPLREKLRNVLYQWDRRQLDLGGDPLRDDWRRFRPLRRDREEDWSDWLAWLLETSKSGRLAESLFGRAAAACCKPTVDREFVAERYRLDFSIRWSENDKTHVELKVGDQDFEKTQPAGEAHRRSNPGARCDDCIILPSEDLSHWRMLGFSEVRPIVWNDVAKHLRVCVISNDESLTWRVWGRAFVGCIEQQLLEFPRVDEAREDSVGDVQALLKHLENHDAD